MTSRNGFALFIMLWRLRERIYVLILNLEKLFAPVDPNDFFKNFQAELQSFSEELKQLNTLCSASTGKSSCFHIFTCILVQIVIVVFSGRIL